MTDYCSIKDIKVGDYVVKMSRKKKFYISLILKISIFNDNFFILKCFNDNMLISFIQDATEEKFQIFNPNDIPEYKLNWDYLYCNNIVIILKTHDNKH